MYDHKFLNKIDFIYTIVLIGLIILKYFDNTPNIYSILYILYGTLLISKNYYWNKFLVLFYILIAITIQFIY